MSCYEQFSWTYDTVRQLPGSEAELLSIYFEELGAYQHKKNKELQSNQSSGGYQDRQSSVVENDLTYYDDWNAPIDHDELLYGDYSIVD